MHSYSRQCSLSIAVKFVNLIYFHALYTCHTRKGRTTNWMWRHEDSKLSGSAAGMQSSNALPPLLSSNYSRRHDTGSEASPNISNTYGCTFQCQWPAMSLVAVLLRRPPLCWQSISRPSWCASAELLLLVQSVNSSIAYDVTQALCCAHSGQLIPRLLEMQLLRLQISPQRIVSQLYLLSAGPKRNGTPWQRHIGVPQNLTKLIQSRRTQKKVTHTVVSSSGLLRTNSKPFATTFDNVLDRTIPATHLPLLHSKKVPHLMEIRLEILT